jgi:hypothetical protein
MSEENTIEIEDAIEEGSQEEEKFSIEGLIPEEVEMAKRHGLVEEEKDGKKQHGEASTSGDESGASNKESSKESSDKEGEQDSEQEEESSKVGLVDNPTFEDVDNNKDNLKKYNPNEQALYWKYKSDKKKRQAAEEKLKEYESSIELNKVKELAYKNKVEKIQSLLGNEDLTVEQIQAIIAGEASANNDNSRPVTFADLESMKSKEVEESKTVKAEQAAYNDRVSTAEEIGKSKYGENFEVYTTLAQEVMANDKTGMYQKMLGDSFNDSDIDEVELVERVVTVAKLSPKFGKDVETTSESSENSNATRAIKNSKKKPSSASIASSGSKRNVSYADLTVEDAARLTTKQWNKIPKEHRDRLLMG